MFFRKLIAYTLLALVMLPAIGSGNNHKLHNLVFVGGGVLGVAHVGALEAIEEQVQPINTIKRFAGTSVGSVLATMAALRYSTAEMRKIMGDLDFSKLADQGITSIESQDIFGNKSVNIEDVLELIYNERGNFGLNSGNFLKCWVEGLVSSKVGKENATFADVKNNGTFGELYIVASNITENKSEVFSAEHTPDMVISEAVRASASVPIMFDVVKKDKKVLVDGGLYNRYPIDLFSDYKFENTLGLNFTPHPLIKNYSITADNMTDKFAWEKYVIAIMTATFTAQHFDYMNSNNSARTVMIHDLGINPLNFNLTNKQKKMLFEEGHRATTQYFKGN